ncbi:unnamed protein product [Cladocopium goreaui]|uniref:Tubulin--tyrosine ligase-like protein 9 n=1 Tax=Cladocopium goreaui TaxID=2562237 RepID=A0A9P1BL16_9DINO|nr:unnamed protein product [Cladocopium goreaui]
MLIQAHLDYREVYEEMQQEHGALTQSFQALDDEYRMRKGKGKGHPTRQYRARTPPPTAKMFAMGRLQKPAHRDDDVDWRGSKNRANSSSALRTERLGAKDAGKEGNGGAKGGQEVQEMKEVQERNSRNDEVQQIPAIPATEMTTDEQELLPDARETEPHTDTPELDEDSESDNAVPSFLFDSSSCAKMPREQAETSTRPPSETPTEAGAELPELLDSGSDGVEGVVNLACSEEQEMPQLSLLKANHPHSAPADKKEDEEDAEEDLFCSEGLPFWEEERSPSASVTAMAMLWSLMKVLCLNLVAVLAILMYEFYHIREGFIRYSPALEDKEHTMRAAQFLTPGEPSVIKTRRIPRPQCCEMTQVLIKVGTGGLNPIDFKMRRNQYVNTMRSLPIVSGYDFSGHVERIGTGVLGFRPGDTVYGMLPLQGTSWGAFQEYVVANYSIIAHVPSKITAREAAGLPLVGLTTIQAMAPVLRHFRKQGQSSKGKKILIQAGGGGVGSFAIQYCKNVLGMYVATTASASKSDLVKGLGADETIDYKKTKFEDVVKNYDVVLDTVTQEYEQRTMSSNVLKSGEGHYINILSSDWEPNSHETNLLEIAAKPFLRKWGYSLIADLLGFGIYYHCNPVSPDAQGLRSIASWVDAGLIKPVVDRSFGLDEVAKAHEYLEKGHATGKVSRARKSDYPQPLSRSPSPDVQSERSWTTTEVAAERPRRKGGQVLLNLSHSDYEVVAQVAEDRGWRVVKCEEKAAVCNVHWIDDANIGDWIRKVEPWMRINHFPGMNNALARKTRLARNMARIQRMFPAAYKFVPPTWVIPDDFPDLEKRFGDNPESKVFYIVKPDHLCQGRGIFLTTELERLRQASDDSRKKNEATVVQRYLSRPMLIEGLKFDLRLYFLIAAKKASGESGLDLRCFLFRDGLVRLCTTPYQPPTAETRNEKCMHLTNYAVNKNSENFQQNDGEDDGAGSKRSLRWFMSYVGETFGEKERRKLWLKLMGPKPWKLCIS